MIDADFDHLRAPLTQFLHTYTIPSTVAEWERITADVPVLIIPAGVYEPTVHRDTWVPVQR